MSFARLRETVRVPLAAIDLAFDRRAGSPPTHAEEKTTKEDY
jgi:hypothetical protein